MFSAPVDRLDEAWPAIALCYAGWIFLGLPAALFRQRKEPPLPWRYACQGGLVVAIPALPVIAAGFGGSGGNPLAFWAGCIGTGALAGFWYWLCAYWEPIGHRALADQPG